MAQAPSGPTFLDEDDGGRNRYGGSVQESLMSAESGFPAFSRRSSIPSTIDPNLFPIPVEPQTQPQGHRLSFRNRARPQFGGELSQNQNSVASPTETHVSAPITNGLNRNNTQNGRPTASFRPVEASPAPSRPGSAGSLVGGPMGEGDIVLPVAGPLAKKLGTLEVFSLIVNKMVGSGIVTGPAQVLLLTGSKQYALLLWGLGFLYTLVSVVLFVEFGYEYRVTGGELVYLDELLGRPSLLMVTVFAIQFIFFWNTSTNCVQVARQILLTADLGLVDKINEQGTMIAGLEGTLPDQSLSLFRDFDPRLQGFVAVVILSLICLLHYFSRTAGRLTNVALAMFKVVMLCVLVGKGAEYASKQGLGDWTTEMVKTGTTTRWSQFAYALFIVLFAFQGWENASFVAGEVDTKKTKALRNGYYSAVIVVGLLYLFVNVAFLQAFPINPGAGQLPVELLASDGFAARYWGYSESSVRGWAVVLTLSALGNVLAVTYTCGRVKQMIGQAYIFPWSRLWARESRFNTPSGGLILHWICSAVLIIVSLHIPNNKGLTLPGALQSYSHAIVALAVTVAFCRFKPTTDYQWSWLNLRRVSWPIIGLSMLTNLAMIILPPVSSRASNNIPGWAYMVICFSAVALSLIYYFSVFPSEKWDKSLSGWKSWSLLRIIGVKWEIGFVNDEAFAERWDEFRKSTRYFEEATAKVAFKDEQRRQFGNRKMVYYDLETDVIEGTGHYQDPGMARKMVFLLFGGDFSNRAFSNPIQDLLESIPSLPSFDRFRRPEKIDIEVGLKVQDGSR